MHLWEALRTQGIQHGYIDLLRNLCQEQIGQVRTDVLSMEFHIRRGAKQGDPLSSLLFNALLEDIFQTLKLKWSQKSFGIQLGHTGATRLSNLRFADDVLLFATTLPQLTTMLTDLHDVAKTYGLELHPDKTHILTNLSKRRGRQAGNTVTVGGRPVTILQHDDSTKYLGRKLTFSDYHTTEINNRISTTWRKFNALRNELTNRRYQLHSRIRIFDTTPTILYGCASWTTTQESMTKLVRTQRRMLRLIIGTSRRRNITPTHAATSIPMPDHSHAQPTTHNDDSLEPWPQYVKRATRTAERISTSYTYYLGTLRSGDANGSGLHA